MGEVMDPKIRSKVQFRKHNLLNGPVEFGFDLIICRNVTIYFTEETKDILNRGFAQSLNDHGILFIGSTESLLDAEAVGFKRVHSSFYRKFMEQKAPTARRTPEGPQSTKAAA